MRPIRFALLILLVLAALAPYATAQTAAPFSIRVQQGTNVQVIADGGTMAYPAEGIGLPVDGSLTISFTGTGATALATVTSMQLTGSTDFVVTSAPDFSVSGVGLTPATPSFAVQVRFTPTTSMATAGRLTFTYSTETGRAGVFSVNLAGTAPEFAYTYAVQPSGNTVLLNAGGGIAFPATAVAQTATVLVTLANRGSGAGSVNSLALSGSPRFVLAGVPFLPAMVDPGRDLKFSIQFTPEDRDAVAAVLQAALAGRSASVNLQGSGLGAAYRYELVTPSGVAPFVPGGMITVPQAAMGGEKTAAAVRVTNTGNAEGRVASVSISGAAFALVETPFMPYTLAPGASFTFKIQFNPTQPGKNAGRLRVGLDDFEVEATALGPSLTYTYAVAGGTVPVAGGGTVVLPAAAVGASSTVVFTVRNDGTAPQDVLSISATGAAFTLSGAPALPRRIEPGSSAGFTVTFAPLALGSASGTLRIDTQSFTLSGAANPPAALPEYAFSGASGALEAAQQPAVGLSLNNTYALAVSGILTLNFTSDVFANDPAVQFSSGGRTVAFTIPAGSRQAVFPNNATQIRIQTGTVAGTISVVPSFTTTQGAIDLTPATPAALNLTVAQTAPRLSSVVVSAKTATGFTLLVSGYATGRAITQMEFQFTPVSGENLGAAKVTIPVEPTFNAWYQSSASAAYGSQFTATVPFTLAGEVRNTSQVTSLADAIQSVSVTLTNRQGVSSASSVNLK